MTGYELTLKNEKLKFYNRISWIIISIHIIIYIYLSLFSGDKSLQGPGIIQLIFMVTLIACRYFLRKSKWRPQLHIFFTLLMVGWITMEQYFIAAIPALFEILYYVSTRKMTVSINEKEIIYPSVPNKTIPWSNINNVILKDGLLTIDSKNNRLIQQFIDESIETVNEKEFNDFCRENLT